MRSDRTAQDFCPLEAQEASFRSCWLWGKQYKTFRLLADSTKAKKLLEWEPKYGGADGFKRGLAKTIEWVTDQTNFLTYKSRKYNI